MPKYQVEIAVHIVGTVDIEADSPEEAAEEAESVFIDCTSVCSSLSAPSIDKDVMLVYDDQDEVVLEVV